MVHRSKVMCVMVHRSNVLPSRNGEKTSMSTADCGVLASFNAPEISNINLCTS